MSTEHAPPLHKTSSVYLAVLLLMVVGFYVLLFLSLTAVALALYKMIIWTPEYLSHARGGGAIKLLFLAYAAVIVFGWAIIKGFLARTGGDPYGIKATREEHPRVFDLTDEVAQRVRADPIKEIFITSEDELGVWEESALYLPPGMGKRKIVLGMAALSYLTLDQLRSILAHEYGHFSNRDTFFSRFIYRVTLSYHQLLAHLGDDKVHLLNPLYWILRAYTWVYERIAASFSRSREFAADRFSVDAFGKPLFAQALVTAHTEGAFFNEVGVKHVVDLATEGKAMRNLYHFVGVSRRLYERDNQDALPEVLSTMLASTTSPFDSHPSLRERLEAQGVASEEITMPNLPRVVADSELEAEMEPDMVVLGRNGAASAAEELFGESAVKIEAQLSDMIAAKYHYLIDMARRAQEE